MSDIIFECPACGSPIIINQERVAFFPPGVEMKVSCICGRVHYFDRDQIISYSPTNRNINDDLKRSVPTHSDINRNAVYKKEATGTTPSRMNAVYKKEATVREPSKMDAFSTNNVEVKKELDVKNLFKMWDKLTMNEQSLERQKKELFLEFKNLFHDVEQKLDKGELAKTDAIKILKMLSKFYPEAKSILELTQKSDSPEELFVVLEFMIKLTAYMEE